jgi:ATP-grasp domain, R2K clade family 3
MRSPVIYLRGSLAEQAELEAAREHFRVVEQRTHVRAGELVILRYSALPWNQELCHDLEEIGAEPINTYRQHCYVADLRNWYYDVGDFTPRTWFALDQIPRDGGPFILKGATNSKKHFWSSLMYAENAKAATDVFVRLTQDGYVGHQPIYIRQYVPLHNLGKGLNGLPISEEYRFFILDKQVVGSGFYWSSHSEDLSQQYKSDAVPRDFLSKIIEIVSQHIRFWVVDIARTAEGDWLVVELNDGCQSGLSDVDPHELYRNMKSVLNLG